MGSLDNLRQEAKRWLAALRRGEASARRRYRRATGEEPPTAPSLRGVQHALARERGFRDWLAIKADAVARDAGRARAGATAAGSAILGDVEGLARDWVAAHDTGDEAALGRLGAHYRRRVTQAELRALAWQRSEDVRRGRVFTLADAQILLAREHGHGSWPALLRALESGGARGDATYALDRRERSIRPRRELDDREWDELLAAAAAHGVTTLDAAGQMTDDLLARVAEVASLTRLELGGSNRLGDAGLAHLARMPQLRELDVSNYPGGPLGDRGLEVLRRLPELRRIALCWQPGVTDEGARHLAACERVESVDLMGTPSGDGAILALAGKNELRRLKTGRRVGDDGLAQLRRIPAFALWRGERPRPALMSPDSGGTHLQLDGPFTDDGLAALAGLEGLAGLDFFWHCSALTAAGLARLRALPNLARLGCGGALCDDQAMRHIAALPRLRMLMAQGTVASDDGFAALALSPTLEALWARDSENLTGRGFAALARLPALRGLAVSCGRVEDRALALLPRFPALRELVPMEVGDAGFRHVGACLGLESLWCMYCRDTTDAATEWLAGLSRLSHYYAGKTRITDRSLEILGGLPSLERLEFWETAGVTDRGLPHLASLPRLREVAIHGLPQVTLAGTEVFPATVKVDYSVSS